VFGWWGFISMFITPIVLLINTIIYCVCLMMPAVPPGARPPHLTEDAASRLFPYVDELFRQMNAGEDFTALCQRIGQQAGVTPGQVALFAHSLVESSNQMPAHA